MANSAPNYKLTLYNKEDSQTPLLTLCDYEFSEFKEANVVLTSLEINKEMYKPGKITALVQFTDCDISIIDEFEKMLGKCVDLEDGVSNNAIAKGYVLCDFEPEFRPSNGSDTLYVKLSIFSPEQMLTYNKRNACYVAKKLGDVFEEIAILADINSTHDNLQNIKCDGKELIQPYMVEFEETPVEFLSRMANRCGEFLFFENGTWQLGATPQASPIVINKYKSLSFHKFTAREPQSYSISNYASSANAQKAEEKAVKKAKLEEYKRTDEYTNLSDNDKKVAEKNWSEQYDKDLAEKKKAEKEAKIEAEKKAKLDEYKQTDKYIKLSDKEKKKVEDNWDELYDNEDIQKAIDETEKGAELKKYKATDAYTKLSDDDKKIAEGIWSKQYDIKKKEFLSNIQYTGPSDEYLEPIIKKDSSYGGTLASKYSNKKYWLTNIPKWLKQDNIAKMVAKVATDIAENLLVTATTYTNDSNEYNKTFFNGLKDKSEQCTDDETRFPLTSAFGITHFSSTFYNNIEENKKESERQKIHINLGTNYISLRLGDTIQIQEHSYVVTKLSNIMKADDSTGNNTLSLEIEAVPVNQTNKSYPSPLAGGTIKKSEPQLATVTSLDDPMQIGRIQIRYPWQEEDEESPYSSPWIRISAACTTAGGGLKFMPQEGDEIMVGYENGNIERPYMIGSLPTKATKGVGEDYMLQSPNGQYIKFDNSAYSGNELFGTFVPAYDTVAKFIPEAKIADFGTITKYGGGIEIGDKLGFYKVSMSSSERSINISSTWGDVSINAFTGITISAPNGDVEIAGKNITINAGNELTLKSGSNLYKKRLGYYFKSKGHFGSFLMSTAANKVADMLDLSIDLSSIRMIMECLFKPVGGTMLIKSSRFMRLEAGKKGKTSLPPGVVADNDDKRPKEVMAYNATKAAINVFDKIMGSVKDTNVFIENARSQYLNFLQEMVQKGSQGLNNTHEFLYDNKPYDPSDITTADDFKFNDILDNCIADDNYKVDDAMTNLNKLCYKLIKESKEEKDFTAIKERVKAYLTPFIEKIHDTKKETVDIAKIKDLLENCNPAFNTSSAYRAKENMGDEERTQMKDLVKEVYNENLKKINEGITKGLNDNDKKNRMRQIIYAVLQKLKENKTILIQDDTGFTGRYNNLFEVKQHKKINLDTTVCDDDTDWANFLKCIKVYDEDEDNSRPALKKITDFVFDHTIQDVLDMVDEWGDYHTHKPEANGEILMTDSSGNTININGTTINADPSSLIVKLKNELKGI